MLNKISSEPNEEESESDRSNLSAKLTENKFEIDSEESDDLSRDEEPPNERIQPSAQNSFEIGSPDLRLNRQTTMNIWNQDVIYDLRKSFDSSLIFESQHEQRLSQILEKKESFSQVKAKRNTITIIKNKNHSEQICRICLDAEVDNDTDPLINPWKCAGSMGNVHVECLKTWVDSKRNTREMDNCRSYNWKQMKWELCNGKYTEEFNYKKLKKFTILSYESEKTKNHIVLESFTHTPNTTIHICEVPEGEDSYEFTIGRSSTVAVRITGNLIIMCRYFCVKDSF
jgi:hypothetical protein